MATFIGTGANETITPATVSATVTRFPLGSFPGAGADVLIGNGGNDVLDGGGGNDLLIGGDGTDRLNGGTGNDNLIGSDGNDSLDGDSGNDVLVGGDGNDFLRGDTGADILIGGSGIDTASYTESAAGVNVNLTTGLGFFGSAAGDTLFGVENLSGSNFSDTLTGNNLANSLSGFDGNDVLNGLAGNDTLNGGDGADRMSGGTGNDRLIGGTGNDTLSGDSGNDTMNGGTGDDLLIGGLGRDSMTGDAGFDRFDFNFVTESPPGLFTRDVITDFVGNGIFAGDRIDVSTIDANAGLAGNQAFSFIGASAFTPITFLTPLGATGQLRYSGGVVQGSIDADAAAEFEIQLTGAPALLAFDITL